MQVRTLRERGILLTAGALAAAAAVFAHSAIVLFVAIGLAVFGATGANATQSMAAASAVPDRQRPTDIPAQPPPRSLRAL